MKIHPQQPRLNNGNNPINVGVYQDLITNTSTATWDRQGFPSRRRNQRKAWVFSGFYNEKIMAGMAVVDAGFVTNAFVYFFIPDQNIFVEDKLTLPYFFPEKFDPGLYSEWKVKNYKISSIGSQMTISYEGKFSLSMTLDNNEKGLSFICPTVDRPFNFTYKNLCIPSTIKVEYKGKTYEAIGDYGSLDFSKGYPPRHTFWNWASITGKTDDGRTFGANLFRGHNDKYENAVWIGEEHILLPLCDFEYSKGERINKDAWKISATNGDLECTFTPVGLRKENLNAIVMKSNFFQCFGKFEGKVKDGEQWVHFEGYGPAEQHEALW